jgi:hypothetical protein
MAFLAGGIAAMAGPWWLPLATFVFGKVDINIDLSINYWIAAILMAVGLAILAFKHFLMDKWARRVAIDKETIAGSPPAADEIRRYFDNLLDDHSYRSSADTAFHAAHNQFADPSNALQDVKTANLFAGFSKDAKALHSFVQDNFYVFPDNQALDSDYRYCLAPDLNIDRNMLAYDLNKVSQYNDLKLDLIRLTEKARESYDSLVARLKKLGHI